MLICDFGRVVKVLNPRNGPNSQESLTDRLLERFKETLLAYKHMPVLELRMGVHSLAILASLEEESDAGYLFHIRNLSVDWFRVINPPLECS